MILPMKKFVPLLGTDSQRWPPHSEHRRRHDLSIRELAETRGRRSRYQGTARIRRQANRMAPRQADGRGAALECDGMEATTDMRSRPGLLAYQDFLDILARA